MRVVYLDAVRDAQIVGGSQFSIIGIGMFMLLRRHHDGDDYYILCIACDEMMVTVAFCN